MTQIEIENMLSSQRHFFRTGKTLDVEFRREALKKLRKAILDHEENIYEAVHKDLGKTRLEVFQNEILPVVREISFILKRLRRWARPDRLYSGIITFPSTGAKVYKMPYGNVLIISPFNFPIDLALATLVPCLAGGNTAIIKVSSKTAASSDLLYHLISRVFPPEYVSVIRGGHDAADMCLAQRFDKIFYTGSPRVAKHIMSEAATNLVPVALELGGETGNWALVMKDADIKDAARKIVFSKLMNAGQVCIAVNHVAVDSTVADEFIAAVKEEIIRQLGDNPSENEEFPKLISSYVFNSCEKISSRYSDRIVSGGTGNASRNRFSPTVIYPVHHDEYIACHELFCPILPVIPFETDKLDDLLEIIEKRERALAFYLFTKDRKFAKHLMARAQFGGGCVNEVVYQILVPGAPFNGTGHSGMGAYQGIWGFREFTRPKTVLYGRTFGNLSLREHPHTGRAGKIKMWISRLFVI